MINNSKGQEEVVGFVVIVVLVAVVFVLMLGFSSKEPIVKENTSKDLRHFLESLRVYTTDCMLSEQVPLEYKDLIGSCYTGRVCLSGKKACDVLNSTVNDILTKSFPNGKDYPIKGVSFNIYYNESTGSGSKILSLFQGNCSTSHRSAEDFFPLGLGQVTVNLRTCY